MGSLLYIAPTDPDEAVLALGALAHALAEMEGAELSVVTPPDAASLYRSAPGLAALHAWERSVGLGEWIELALTHAKHPFDLLLDLSGAPGGYAIRARRRVARRTPRALMHRTEEYARLMQADAPLAPVLWIDAEARSAAEAVRDGAGPLLVLAPGTRARGQVWPNERFAAVGRRLASGVLGEARVVLAGGEADKEACAAIASSLDADGVAVRDMSVALDLPAQAALAERATLVLGLDNLTTQLAAAAGAPTLALFGPTDERVRGPHGARARTLRARDFEAAMGLPALEGASLLDDISVDEVEAAAADLLRAGGLL